VLRALAILAVLVSAISVPVARGAVPTLSAAA